MKTHQNLKLFRYPHITLCNVTYFKSMVHISCKLWKMIQINTTFLILGSVSRLTTSIHQPSGETPCQPALHAQTAWYHIQHAIDPRGLAGWGVWGVLSAEWDTASGGLIRGPLLVIHECATCQTAAGGHCCHFYCGVSTFLWMWHRPKLKEVDWQK